MRGVAPGVQAVKGVAVGDAETQCADRLASGIVKLYELAGCFIEGVGAHLGYYDGLPQGKEYQCFHAGNNGPQACYFKVNPGLYRKHRPR